MCKCCGKGHADKHVDLKEIKLLEKINAYRGEPGALIPVLQEAQEIYGYLPQGDH
jgi:NADH-quinone oxidoreductase subunit E